MDIVTLQLKKSTSRVDSRRRFFSGEGGEKNYITRLLGTSASFKIRAKFFGKE